MEFELQLENMDFQLQLEKVILKPSFKYIEDRVRITKHFPV